MLKRTRFVILALVLGLGTVACRAQVRATAIVSAPSLVLIDGDVWVVEHYNEPVFYTESYYWRWYGGVWYRSTVHTGGWVQVSVVPAQVQRIEKPDIYVNYTAPAGAQKRTGPPDHAPAHGVRGTEPGHAEEHGPPGTPPGQEKKETGGGPPPGKGNEEKVGPPAKEEKAMKPPKEEKPAPPAKEEKPAKPAKEEKAPPAKDEKPKEEKGKKK